MGRKIISVFLAVLLLAVSVISASAEEFDPEKTGSVSVTLTEQYEKTPIVGAELSLYYIATVGINTDGKLNYIFTEDFAESGISLDDTELATKLDVYLFENEVPSSKKFTDEEGAALWKNLPLGLYFVRQTNSVEGFAPCTSFLVTVPMESTEGYVYDVNASPKTEVAKLISITIRKLWNTDATTKIADSVTVQLLRNETVVETAILDESNDWQVTYTNLPESDGYTIQEVNVPKGFVATYQQNAYVFTVTNTSSLIITGQLVWPIPLLAGIGMLLLAVGSVLLRKKRKQNE